MGKRNKGEQNDNIVKTKKKKSEKNTSVNEEVKEERSSNVETTSNEKTKKIVLKNDKSSKIDQVKKPTEEQKTNSLKRSRNKSTISNGNNVNNKTKQNKKIIFADDNDEGTEVTTNRENGATIRECAEEGPGDEEIDKFCDELDEEDNVHFDNWVKLIETKLCPNKNK
ncbi:MATH and LRR domain-containing protein PFE0570w-like [Pararge aegeria]|uniref:MATH and LRR domain-containing protein PFE0570w-like n=1 Tax=Pararge aegeria TaxID=116150 RepID=UPI0019D250C5|nr:MATH and LRR domain-containing protein PFE0570w-like [Pararge aegeria]XP_039756361.1 MATH and LRR domain-containing protein PFE0570w-like [Pararge aegeria]